MYILMEKSDTHDTYSSHASPRTPLIHFLWAVPVRGNISRWCNRVRWMYFSWEKVLPTPALRLVEWPMRPAPISLPKTTIKAVCLSQAFVDEHTTSVYLAYISNIWSVRSTCSWESTNQSLTDTDEGYHLGGLGLPHHSPHPSQPRASTLP
jgi:hypothetical protein